MIDMQFQTFSEDLSLLEEKGYSILSEVEERELLIQAKQGNRNARNKLVQCNVKLILQKAKSLHKQYPHVPILDMFQEGVIGFIKAIDHFDMKYSIRLTTYSNKAIKQQILRAVFNQYSEIKIPEKLRREYNKKEKQGLLWNEETSQKMDPKLEYLKQIEFQSVAHIDSLIGEEHTLTLADTLMDVNDEQESLQQDLNLRHLRYCLQENLTNCQYYILYHRVLSPQKKTLEQLSKELHITIEGVRRAQNNIIQKIRKKYVDESTATLKLNRSCATADLPPFEPLPIFYHVSFYALRQVVDEFTYAILYQIYVKRISIPKIMRKTQLSFEKIFQIMEEVKQQYPWFLNPTTVQYQQLEEDLRNQISMREMINQDMEPTVSLRPIKEIIKTR